MLDPTTNRIVVSRDVRFVDGVNENGDNQRKSTIMQNVEKEQLVHLDLEFGNRTGQVEYDIDEDDEFQDAVVEPVNEIVVAERVSQRLNKGCAPKRLIDVCMAQMNDQPTCLKDILKSKDSVHWKEAII